MSADNMKLFINIKSSLDYLKLQATMDLLVSWGEGFSLNISKCHVMNFIGFINYTKFNYLINESAILILSELVRDLGLGENCSYV